MADRVSALEGASDEVRQSLLKYKEKHDYLVKKKHEDFLEATDDIILQEYIIEQYNIALSQLETIINEPWKFNIHEKAAKSWINDIEYEVYQKLKRGKAKSFLRVEKSNSIKYILTEKPPIDTVINNPYIGAHVLAKAKVSIIEFAQSIHDEFDPGKNKKLQKYLDDMALEKVWPSLIFSDTDSVYFNFLAVSKVYQPSVTEEYYQDWVRQTIICYNFDRIDTSNFTNSPFRVIKNKKMLNKFQFETDTPCIQQIIANNPKIKFNDYLRRVQPFSTLMDNEESIRSEKVNYTTLRNKHKKTFMYENSKVGLATLSDKVHIFQQGIQILQHGHALLKNIYEASKGKTSEELQRDDHLLKLCLIEQEILKQHPRLCIYKKKIEQNVDNFNYVCKH